VLRPRALATEPAPLADDPACAAVAARWPDQVAGRPRVTVAGDPRGVAAWGDPVIVARCGVVPPPPSTNDCVAADGVDWVARGGGATSERHGVRQLRPQPGDRGDGPPPPTPLSPWSWGPSPRPPVRSARASTAAADASPQAVRERLQRLDVDLAQAHTRVDVPGQVRPDPLPPREGGPRVASLISSSNQANGREPTHSAMASVFQEASPVRARSAQSVITGRSSGRPRIGESCRLASCSQVVAQTSWYRSARWSSHAPCSRLATIWTRSCSRTGPHDVVIEALRARRLRPGRPGPGRGERVQGAVDVHEQGGPVVHRVIMAAPASGPPMPWSSGPWPSRRRSMLAAWRRSSGSTRPSNSCAKA
jgi:hypothetical protein